MARVRTAKYPKLGELVQAPTEVVGASEGPGKITKSEAARRAIDAGHDKPKDAVAYILEEFGIEMGAQHFSTIKTGMKKDATAPKGKPGRPPKSQAVEGYLSPPPKARADGEGDLLAAMEAIKPLVAALGADKVKRIADLLA